VANEGPAARWEPNKMRKDRMPDWMQILVQQVERWPLVSIHEHRFGGVEFRVGAREVGHVHDFGIVDIPLRVRVRDALIRAGGAERHHWLPNSGWTTVRAGECGSDNALQLLRLSYLLIQRKSPDPAVVDQAATQLESCGLEPEILDAVRLPTPVPHDAVV
jgi:hypothetical protein